MYIKAYNKDQIEKGIDMFNRIIESGNVVRVHKIANIGFWGGPVILGEIEDPNVWRAVELYKFDDMKYLDYFGWTEKIDYSNIQKQYLDKDESEKLNRVYEYTLTLPEPKELN